MKLSPIKQIIQSVAAITALAFLPAISQAQITVQDTSTLSVGAGTGTTPTDSFTTSSFTVTGGDLLVVELLDRNVNANNPGANPPTINAGLTWNGQALTELTGAVSNQGSYRTAEIYYLLNPTAASGTIVGNIGNNTSTNTFAVQALTLNNVDLTKISTALAASQDSSGVSPGTAAVNSLTINNVAGGSFGLLLNNVGNASESFTESGTGLGGSINQLYSSQAMPSSSIYSGYYTNLAAGSDTCTSTVGTASQKNVMSVAVFEAQTSVPEPSSFALIGLGLGALLWYSRRRFPVRS